MDAKCQNQYALAEHIAPEDKGLAALRENAYGKKPHKESICAKAFWQIFGRSLNDEEFVRDRARGGWNNLLNYGYAVLLSTVLQKLFGMGLDPNVRHFARAARTQHTAGVRFDGAISPVCRVAGDSMDPAAANSCR